MDYGDENALNDYWCYDPATDTWDSVARLPGKRLSNASTFTYNNKGYVVGGYSYYDMRTTDSIHVYDPVSDSWSTMTDTLPTDLSNAYWMTHGAPGICHSGRKGEVAFVANGKAYAGLGQGNTDADYYKDFYEYSFPLTADSTATVTMDPSAIKELSIFPNPNTNEFTLHYAAGKSKSLQLRIYNSLGAVVYQKTVNTISGELNEQISLQNGGRGVYHLEIIAGEEKSGRLIVVE